MDLWVFPPPTKSSWFAKIDWYLNWQMCRGLAHVPQRPAPELMQLTSENGMHFPEFALAPHAPLMVISQGRVPAAQCLVVEFNPSLKVWLTQIHQVSEQLRVQAMRVYLPSGTSVTEAQQVWNSFSTKIATIEFLPDEGTIK